MNDSMDSLHHKINSAADLKSVVRTMKAIAASNISQYENAVKSLDDYYRTVQLGLTACVMNNSQLTSGWESANSKQPGIFIIFGSDQGLVGQFNQRMASFVQSVINQQSKPGALWLVGERINTHLPGDQSNVAMHFKLPNSVNTITALIDDILRELEVQLEQGNLEQVCLVNHQPQSGSSYKPVCQQLLPLDQRWLQDIVLPRWPTNKLPQLLGAMQTTFPALVREYLFMSLFKACAESLASENASRLAAMRRAEKNIDDLQANLHQTFHRLRQTGIDEELFDLIGGFDALNKVE
ncbi:F0F1 ATP synthase subunit gamma [Neptunicella marina]|uniref:F0F1 ATP synthase subunit gamma n=1 Tax=Neptunicella marina TaxID=2125989 RepID=A0A8J6IRB1_9ALTE|nr:F0F1 ATP synthase subunit gamma [Neptunicella marina]MBC3764462.1 F0F1 ATP synthase subunit gamma [Neptunicella marina]